MTYNYSDQSSLSEEIWVSQSYNDYQRSVLYNYFRKEYLSHKKSKTYIERINSVFDDYIFENSIFIKGKNKTAVQIAPLEHGTIQKYLAKKDDSKFQSGDVDSMQFFEACFLLLIRETSLSSSILSYFKLPSHSALLSNTLDRAFTLLITPNSTRDQHLSAVLIGRSESEQNHIKGDLWFSKKPLDQKSVLESFSGNAHLRHSLFDAWNIIGCVLPKNNYEPAWDTEQDYIQIIMQHHLTYKPGSLVLSINTHENKAESHARLITPINAINYLARIVESDDV